MDCQRRRKAVVDDANADDNAERDTDDCDVPWEAWVPQATAVFEDTNGEQQLNKMVKYAFKTTTRTSFDRRELL
jgi:hypothetical protein